MTVSTTTGKDRLFGPSVQDRLAELRRQAGVGMADVVEPETAAGTFSRTVDIIRRVETVAANPARGIAGTWADVAGLDGLVAHVRTVGKWRREGEQGVWIRSNERIITVMDIPATGAGNTAVPANVLTTTDRIKYVDPIFGEITVQVVEVNHRETSGQVTALCSYDDARED